MKPELVVKTRAEVGEGPIWDLRTQTLLWVDITGSAIHRYDPRTRQNTTIQTGVHVGAVSVRASGGLVLAAADGFRGLDSDGTQSLLVGVEHDNPAMRMNDGKCDRRGRFWAGTMAYDEAGPSGLGSLYRLDPDLQVTQMVEGVSISNGIDWSPDDCLMYFIDSRSQTVDVFDFDVDEGSIQNRRTLIEVDAAIGLPDGMTVDAKGDLWVAMWGGARISRYGPDGTPREVFQLPVSQTSSCGFGGPKLDRLYVTTAARGVSEDTEPDAGSLYRIPVGGVWGQRPNEFAG